EQEHLLFGLHSQALAIYSIGFTLAYTHRTLAEGRFAVIVVMTGAFLAASLMLHFSLVFARVKEAFRIMRVVYAITAALEIGSLDSEPVKILDPSLESLQLGPLVVDHLRVATTELGRLVCFFLGTLTLASVALLVRAVVGGRRDGIA